MDLKHFLNELNERKKYIDYSLVNYITPLNTFPSLIHDAMHYAVFNGGKRLRPIMVLEGAVLAEIDREMVIPTACAVELIHSYSLVHDDLPAMDDDDMRRGKPTCHKIYGEDMAILTGDALLTLAFELIASNADIPGIRPQNVLKAIKEISYSAGSQGMIGGQVIDLESEGKDVDYETLQKLHSLKTGELFKASLVSGAILGGMSEDGVQLLKKYAYHFGLAFQITDDILDVKGDALVTGKPVGSDEKNNKTTYPSLFGLAKSQKLAEENIDICLETLKNFGDRANFLKNLALYTLKRNS